MISLLVVSDIHATNESIENDGAVSWFSTLPIYNTEQRNPFLTIPKILKQESLQVDYVLCPGDLADGAKPEQQAAAWSALSQLQKELNAKRLIGTVGNHDIDSRTIYSSFDPKSNLQALQPMFPGLTESECDFYWSRNFVVLKEGDLTLVVLNSCAFHGISSAPPSKDQSGKDARADEYRHGRVSDRTINSLRQHLADNKAKLNILLVHHHIYKNERIMSADYSEMKGGLALVDALEQMSNTPWLIVHGHQHYPKLFYAAGTANSPVVLSAGSLSRRLTGPLVQNSVNQFYHVQIDLNVKPQIGFSPTGIVRSWHWTDQVGWEKSLGFHDKRISIPFGSGFGCRLQPTMLATAIAKTLRETRRRVIPWEQFCGLLPTIRYVLPGDMAATIRVLRDQHNISLTFDEYGYPVELGIRENR